MVVVVQKSVSVGVASSLVLKRQSCKKFRPCSSRAGSPEDSIKKQKRMAPPPSMATRKRALAGASGRVRRNLKSAKIGSPKPGGRSAKRAIVFRVSPVAFPFICGGLTGPTAAELGMLK